jgi:hypothetical protein
MNTSVFGQHDPGKTPMGKTGKRVDVLRISQANATTMKLYKGT